MQALTILFLVSGVLCHQRSPPGINPNQYQAQPQHKPPPSPQYQVSNKKCIIKLKKVKVNFSLFF